MITGCRTLGTLLLSAALLAAGAAAAADLSGGWKGRWESCTSGHKGPLKAEFCRVGSCQYEVTFRGRFLKILPFKYSVRLRVVRQDGDTLVLRGSQKLRKYGVFHYTARADRCTFHADYCSAEDRGYFHLERR